MRFYLHSASFIQIQLWEETQSDDCCSWTPQRRFSRRWWRRLCLFCVPVGDRVSGSKLVWDQGLGNKCCSRAATNFLVQPQPFSRENKALSHNSASLLTSETQGFMSAFGKVLRPPAAEWVEDAETEEMPKWLMQLAAGTSSLGPIHCIPRVGSLFATMDHCLQPSTHHELCPCTLSMISSGCWGNR